MYDMGRKLPLDNISLIHPFIYLSFFAASFAASMGVILALCSMGFRRKTSFSSPSDSVELEKDLEAAPPTSETDKENNNENNEEQVKELPLPPALAAMQHPKDPFISERMKRVTSERKMPISLSIKMPRSLSMARNWDHHHKEEKNKGNIEGKLKAEDSVWMKTIILGEKCNPDEENDPVIYEGRGKRISAYHTRKHSTVSMCRQNSSLDMDALSLSVPQTQVQDERNNDAVSR